MLPVAFCTFTVIFNLRSHRMSGTELRTSSYHRLMFKWTVANIFLIKAVYSVYQRKRMSWEWRFLPKTCSANCHRKEIYWLDVGTREQKCKDNSFIIDSHKLRVTDVKWKIQGCIFLSAKLLSSFVPRSSSGLRCKRLVECTFDCSLFSVTPLYMCLT